MPAGRCERRAPILGALFVWSSSKPTPGRAAARHRWYRGHGLGALLLAAALWHPAPAAADQVGCASTHYDDTARVGYVYDGDTIRLTDGRRVRFIGVDTPETGKHGEPSQPYADAARDTLRRWIRANPQVHLRYDRTHHDHYGRVLAHVFLDDGTSVTARLLQAGLGTALVIPPNLWHYPCYAAAEAQARQDHRGIWSLAAYQPQAAAQISKRTRGFHIVTGRIVHVGESRHSLWLDLAGQVSVFIPRDHLHYFPKLDTHNLVGRQLEARGWLHYHKGHLIMRVLHPAALEWLDAGVRGHQAGAAPADAPTHS